MIFILGASGYVGQQFAYELDTRGIEYMEISREEYNYYIMHICNVYYLIHY